MSDLIQSLTSDTFQDTIEKSDVPVLVDFWAPWCGPCKAIAPVLEELAEEFSGKVKICKVDVDDNGDIASKFNIRAIPTLLLFKGGEIAEQFVGMVGKADLHSKISNHI